MRSLSLVVVSVTLAASCSDGSSSSSSSSTEEKFDTSAIYTVWPVSAEIDATNNGTAWDADGSPPDVFVSFTCPGGTQVDTAQSESYTPTWNGPSCSAKASDLIGTGVTYTVYDYDALSANDTVNPTVRGTWSEAVLKAGSAVFQQSSGGVKKITWNAVKQ